jgi:hypothetical protein
MITTVTRLGAIAATTAIVALSACGSDAPNSAAESSTVTIEAVDYGFNGVPSSVRAGTAVAFRNTAPAELHELVAFRLPDGDDIALDDLVRIPTDELRSRIGAPVMVLLQPPGSDEQIVAVGDGALTEPGRYVLMCFIPTGADPDEYLAATAASEDAAPTGVAGGPPHFVNGMYAELQVDA